MRRFSAPGVKKTLARRRVDYAIYGEKAVEAEETSEARFSLFDDNFATTQHTAREGGRGGVDP